MEELEDTTRATGEKKDRFKGTGREEEIEAAAGRVVALNGFASPLEPEVYLRYSRRIGCPLLRCAQTSSSNRHLPPLSTISHKAIGYQIQTETLSLDPPRFADSQFSSADGSWVGNRVCFVLAIASSPYRDNRGPANSRPTDLSLGSGHSSTTTSVPPPTHPSANNCLSSHSFVRDSSCCRPRRRHG